MDYRVVVTQDGEQAILPCESFEDAQQVRQSFVNYGKCSSVVIEAKDPTLDWD